jgi:hypothetical protein
VQQVLLAQRVLLVLQVQLALPQHGLTLRRLHQKQRTIRLHRQMLEHLFKQTLVQQ